jgi:hypothetical protein
MNSNKLFTNMIGVIVLFALINTNYATTSSPSSVPTSTLCSTCSAGQYYDDDCTTKSCKNCKPGYYCLGECADPTPCPAGTFTSVYGSSVIEDCLSCPYGYVNSVSGSVTCTPCPSGYGCTNTSSVAVICEKGYYSPGLSECQMCSNGTYSNRRGSSTCSTCPAGYACADPSAGMYL